MTNQPKLEAPAWPTRGGRPACAKTYVSVLHAISRGWRRWRLYPGFAGVISGLRVYWTQCHPRRWTPGLLRAIRRLNNRYRVHAILHVMIARNKRAVRAGSELESPHSGPSNAEMALGSPPWCTFSHGWAFRPFLRGQQWATRRPVIASLPSADPAGGSPAVSQLLLPASRPLCEPSVENRQNDEGEQC